VPPYVEADDMNLYEMLSIHQSEIDDIQKCEASTKDIENRNEVPKHLRALEQKLPAASVVAQASTTSDTTEILKAFPASSPPLLIGTSKTAKTKDIVPFLSANSSLQAAVLRSHLPPPSALKQKAAGSLAARASTPRPMKKAKFQTPLEQYSSLELEQLGEVLREVRGGYLSSGLWLSRLEKQEYIRAIRVAETGSIDDLKQLNLYLDEIQRLPQVFQKQLLPQFSAPHPGYWEEQRSMASREKKSKIGVAGLLYDFGGSFASFLESPYSSSSLSSDMLALPSDFATLFDRSPLPVPGPPDAISLSLENSRHRNEPRSAMKLPNNHPGLVSVYNGVRLLVFPLSYKTAVDRLFEPPGPVLCADRNKRGILSCSGSSFRMRGKAVLSVCQPAGVVLFVNEHAFYSRCF
jgi:hypothetical protein